MSGMMLVAMFAFMLLTVAALGFGLFSMVMGGKMSAKYSNKMMVLRVALQGVAVVLIALLVLLK